MDPSLVILAAGIGSRYGGIKQLDGFGPHGERIIDYTVYDAIKAGYGKIIFVIRKEIEDDFNQLILEKWKNKAEVRVVHQELDSLPPGYIVPDGRVRPWGTAHATWMAEKEISEPFAIVNADDFYGFQSLKEAADHLRSIESDEHGACIVAYEISKTLTEFGSVSRGVCQSSQQGFLTEIIERTKVFRNGDGKIYFEENKQNTCLDPGTLVSMNLMGFSPKVFEVIRSGFDEIYQQANDNPKIEYYIPSVLNQLIHLGVKVPVIPTKDHWFGVTYLEDKTWVQQQFDNLHKENLYPGNLWS